MSLSSTTASIVPCTPVAPTRKRSIASLDRERRERREETVFSHMTKRIRSDSVLDRSTDSVGSHNDEEDPLVISMASSDFVSSPVALPHVTSLDKAGPNVPHFRRMRPRMLSFDSERSHAASLPCPCDSQRSATDQRDDVDAADEHIGNLSSTVVSLFQSRPRSISMDISDASSVATPNSLRSVLQAQQRDSIFRRPVSTARCARNSISFSMDDGDDDLPPILPSLNQLDRSVDQAETDLPTMITTLRPRFGQDSVQGPIFNSVSFDEDCDHDSDAEDRHEYGKAVLPYMPF